MSFRDVKSVLTESLQAIIVEDGGKLGSLGLDLRSLDPNFELCKDFNRVCDRVVKMLVGDFDISVQEKLFELFLDVHDNMVIEKTDSIGCSKSTCFEVELLDPSCKPVCH